MAHVRPNVFLGLLLTLSTIGCSDSKHRGLPAHGTQANRMDAGAPLPSRAQPQVRPFAGERPSSTGRVIPPREVKPPIFGDPDAGRDPLDTVVVLPDPGDLDYAATTIKLRADGASQRLRFDVPSDAWSFVASATAADPKMIITLETLVGPDGMLFPASPSAKDSQRYRPTMNASEAAMPYAIMVPNRPELAFPKGTYELQFYAWRALESSTELAAEGTELSVDVVFRRSKAEPSGGKIDLLFLIGSNSLFDAEAAATDPDLQDTLQHAATLLVMAGITIGKVTYENVDRQDYEDDAGALEHAPVAAMLSEHASEAAEAIRVIWLERYDEIGIAMGIPGAPARLGLSRVSPAVMELRSRQSWESDRVGLTLAHEIGHLLGLAHTTERDWTTHDQLRDTPECTTKQATEHDDAGVPSVYAADCVGHGLDNVMFWAGFEVVPFETLNFSADQSWVMRRNPFVH